MSWSKQYQIPGDIRFGEASFVVSVDALFVQTQVGFQSSNPLQHQDVFSKGMLAEFCQLQPFEGS